MNAGNSKQASKRLVLSCKYLLALALPLGLVGCTAETDQASDTQPNGTREVADSTSPAAPMLDIMPVEIPTTNSLSIGDAAPEIHLAKFVKGEPVDMEQSDRVHVIEFWATWCGPCRAGMPHISELQQHHGDDVAFVGVTQEDESTVTGFLGETAMNGKSWDDVIQYRLALDDASQTSTNYMEAAGQNGIPCAFIVGRDGFVEWIGHPAGIDEPLQQVVDGTWDRETAVKKLQAEKKMQEIAGKLGGWINAQEWDKALQALEEIEADLGPNPNLSMTKLSILEQAGKTEEAAQLRAKIVESEWENSQTLNAIAWDVATSAGNMELALRAATRANELTESANASIIDTLARVYYEMGELDQAIEWQQKAIDVDGGATPQIAAALQKYTAEKESKSSDE
ncbi:MAG: redoxin family protein [Rubripirellula sp.]|nr:redoxin family protein [Rubripirellula sp.]